MHARSVTTENVRYAMDGESTWCCCATHRSFYALWSPHSSATYFHSHPYRWGWWFHSYSIVWLRQPVFASTQTRNQLIPTVGTFFFWNQVIFQNVVSATGILLFVWMSIPISLGLVWLGLVLMQIEYLTHIGENQPCKENSKWQQSYVVGICRNFVVEWLLW